MYSLRSVQARQKSKKTIGNAAIVALFGTIMAISTGVVLFIAGTITLGGVPYSVVSKVWQNPEARNALMSGDETKLHDLMGGLGIEYEIKEHYRSRIQDPVELDQHIHQILFDRTGYVGEAYTVKGRTLVLKDPAKLEQLQNCPNC
ncbi:hypothetical protein [Leptothoe sp. PORK10 BA2]|uniref:hypothetical protein n=1 Tax=Leptothoe sp. PORK10 BA2 TaxID=3110254 RepID=UPI002B2087B1|nr:hypothetical protein [Leptothoe sp. PORK10 BA2]MEA5463647.1 hypothetical protein [Leptothoe sp. PORK10 BA2]